MKPLMHPTNHITCNGSIHARRIAGRNEPPVTAVRFSLKMKEIPRIVWNTIRVMKKEMAKRMSFLTRGKRVDMPRTKVGIFPAV